MEKTLIKYDDSISSSLQNLRQLKDLVLLMVQRDLRVRYRGSFLGYIWSMLNPLLHMTILTIVFSNFIRVKTESYALFILSGIMAWNLFHQSIAIGINSISGAGHLLKKVKIPAYIFPLASIAGVMVNFLLSFLPFFIISAVLGLMPSLKLLLIPLFLLPFLVFIFGIVLGLSSLNVKFRDIGHAMEPILQLLFYGSPVIYSFDIVPEKWRALLELNPMAHFIQIFRSLTLQDIPVEPRSWLISAIVAFLALMIGIWIYRKKSRNFTYEL